MRNLILSILLVIGVVASTEAQSQQFRFTHLTIEDGLPDNYTRVMHMDKKGFIWVGTNNGLARYDGYTFKNYSSIEGDTTALRGNIIKSIIEDKEGHLWLGTIGGGLTRFDPVSEIFTNYPYVIKNPNTEAFNATSLIQDKNENIWIGTFSCGLQFFDKKTQKFERYDFIENVENRKDAFEKNTVHTLIQDKSDENKIWLGGNRGMYFFDKTTKQFQRVPLIINGAIDTTTSIMNLHMEKPNELWVGTWRLGLGRMVVDENQWEFMIPNLEEFEKENHFSNIISDINFKSENELWVCSQDEGLMVLNKTTKQFEHIKNDPADNYSILTNKVNGMYQDEFDRTWFFNFQNGISFIDPSIQLFNYRSLQHNSICDVLDAKVFDFSWDNSFQRLYATTIGCEALFVFDDKDLLKSRLINLDAASSEDGYGVLASKKGLIWLAGGKGDGKTPSLYNYDFESNKLIPFSHPDLGAVPIHNYKLNDILEDKEGNILLGTSYGGLIKISNKTGELKQYINKASATNSITNLTEISQLKLAQNGIIWISTLQEGIFSFDLSTEEFKQYTTSDDPDRLGLRASRVMALDEDDLGRIWVGLSSTGIQVIDPKEEEDWVVESFQVVNGLPNEEIWNVKREENGNIWLGTQNGLVRFDKETKSFLSYSKLDGIKDPVFRRKGMLALENGKFYLGQTNEFCSFSPNQISNSSLSQQIAFTSFKVFEKEYKGDKELSYSSQIDLDHDQNFFTISFSKLSFSNINKNRYSYKLDGYENNWNYQSGDRNFASYTKVPPGAYTFIVKSGDIGEQETKFENRIRIVITPPVWRRWWAYLSYFALSVLIIGWLINHQNNRRKTKEEALRLKELNKAKTKLFNNITHELRTPLTVVLGSVDRAKRLQRSLTKPELNLVKQNGEHLLNLINQVLDLGKLDAGAMALNNSWEDIISFMKYVTYSFETLADEKSIQLNFEAYPATCRGFFDKEKLSLIISNLISNAVKFTPETGQISIFVKINDTNSTDLTQELKNVNESLKTIVIQIQDTGIGISEDHLPHIFNRFYQVENSSKQELIKENEPKGTGIGLSLTKEVVGLMGGTIKVDDSKIGVGTNFRVEIPFVSQQSVPEVHSAKKSDNLPVVLLVEDNPSLVEYVSGGLSPHFNLLIENNGKDGLDRAIEVVPDVVISDVVMPIMNGFTLCKNLKENSLTSHIPVILLTAKIGQEAKMEGLGSGADAYLTKPFDEQELLLRIQNLLEHQNSLRAFYVQKNGLTDEQEISAPSTETDIEDEFLTKVKEVIQENLNNPQFSIAVLAQKIGLSSTQLHRKVVALTGLPPVKLLKTIRIKSAKNLLLTTSMTISEIAYEVGFTDPGYFSKTFKLESGLTPKNFRQKLK